MNMWVKIGEVMLFVQGLLLGACIGALTLALIVENERSYTGYQPKNVKDHGNPPKGTKDQEV